MLTTRVLLADDSQDMLDAISAVIEHAPGVALVGVAHDGEAALAQAVDRLPDVAVVDVRMPGGGPGLVEALLREVPTLRVVVLSADSSEHLRARMLQAGASAYLVKGDPAVDLVAVITAPPD